MPSRDRKRPFWSKWVWKDWDVKTRDLSPHEYTAYHRLLSYAATCSPDLCSIPDDDARLARASGLGLKQWKMVRERVLDYFLPVGGRWVHDRLQKDASRFLQLVANPPSRVNGPGTSEASTRAGVRSKKLEVRLTEESSQHTCPPDGVRAGGPPAAVKADPRAEWLEAFTESFYPQYPRKVKPDDARKAWLQMKPWSQDNCDAIFNGMVRWKRHWHESETPKDKIPYPATFLRGGQWKEEPQ